jgi:hypothetical protein
MQLNPRRFVRVGATDPPDREGPSRSHLRARANQSIISLMEWTTPSYEELKMDAEIGSYQEDGEWPPIVEPQQDAAAE